MADGVRPLTPSGGGVQVGDPGAGRVSEPGSATGMPDGPNTRPERQDQGGVSWRVGFTFRHTPAPVSSTGQFRRDTDTITFLLRH